MPDFFGSTAVPPVIQGKHNTDRAITAETAVLPNLMDKTFHPANSPILILAGPTAVGKTALAVRLAQEMGRRVVSADSMQVYRGMEIGTAQPPLAERGGVPHDLIGHVEPGEEYHAGRFAAEATAILGCEPALVVGGTGLFLKALVEGLIENAPRDAELRRRLAEWAAEVGEDAVRERLRAVDLDREREINRNDLVRLLRALEVYELTGEPMSASHRRQKAERLPLPCRYAILTRSRPALMARIDARVDAMMGAGWLEEARRLLDVGLDPESQAGKALGYRSLFRHLRGEIGLSEAIAEIKKATRAFAKRQQTWFRSVPGALWVDLEALGEEQAEALLLRHYAGEDVRTEAQKTAASGPGP